MFTILSVQVVSVVFRWCQYVILDNFLCHDSPDTTVSPVNPSLVDVIELLLPSGARIIKP